MKKANVFRVVMLGIFTAIAIILTFTPLGYIPVGVLSITTIHIPIIVAAILMGTMDGAIVGAIVGLLCMVKAATFQTAATDYLFINPLLSLVPRILIGLVTSLVFIGICRLFRKSNKAPARIVSVTIAAVAGTLTNTVGVLTAFGLLYPDRAEINNAGEIFTKLIATTFATNGVFEIIAAIVLAVPIVMALEKVKGHSTAT